MGSGKRRLCEECGWLNPEDVMAVGRTKNLTSIHEIKYTILERNGTISIIKAD